MYTSSVFWLSKINKIIKINLFFKRSRYGDRNLGLRGMNHGLGR